MATEQIITLGVFIAMLVGFMIPRLSMGLVSLAAMGLLMIFKVTTTEVVMAQVGQDTLLLMIFMFIVAAGLTNTRLTSHVSKLVNKVTADNFSIALILYLLVGLILAQTGMRGVAVLAITYPFMIQLCEDHGLPSSTAIFSMAVVVLCARDVLPIGQGAVTFARTNATVARYGFDMSGANAAGMFDLMKIKLPSMILIMLYSAFIMPKLAPRHGLAGSDLKQSRGRESDRPHKRELSRVQEIIAYVTFVAVIIGFMAADKIGIEPWLTSLIGMLVMMFSGVVNVKEAAQAIPLRALAVFIGACTMAVTLVNTGTGDVIGNFIAGLMGGTQNPFVLTAVFFTLPFIMSQFMNNSAAGQIFTPLVMTTAAALGCNPLGAYYAVQCGCQLAFLTPMANPGLPVIMDAGKLTQKDMFKMGLPLAVVLIVFHIVLIPILFPFY